MNNTRFFIGLILAILFSGQLFAQTGVIISTEANQVPHESAMLEIKSTEKGLLIPRMTANQKMSINPSADAIGLIIFQTDQTQGFYYWTGTIWLHLTEGVENMTTNTIPKWNGTNLTNSNLSESNSTLTYSGNLIATDTIKTNKRIKDKSGIIIPVGTILPFGGESDKIPEGWLLCNGDELNAVTNQEYQDLYNIIGNNWGGTHNYNFKVPDLQGQFLRGADLTNPSSTANENRTGGSSNEKIGSFQDDAFQGHYHNKNENPHSHSFSTYYEDNSGGANTTGTLNGTIGQTNHNTSSDYSGVTITEPLSDGINNTPRTTSETRPTNIYVNYILKY